MRKTTLALLLLCLPASVQALPITSGEFTLGPGHFGGGSGILHAEGLDLGVYFLERFGSIIDASCQAGAPCTLSASVWSYGSDVKHISNAQHDSYLAFSGPRTTFDPVPGPVALPFTFTGAWCVLGPQVSWYYTCAEWWPELTGQGTAYIDLVPVGNQLAAHGGRYVFEDIGHSSAGQSVTITAVPEPATLLLLAGPLGWMMRRKR